MTGAEGAFDYIVSSHNFEHLPDPIRFLQDASLLLRKGGSLSMAIPIGSRCFDLMRPLSTTGQIIDAHMNGLRQPSVGTVFDDQQGAVRLPNGVDVSCASTNLKKVMPRTSIEQLSSEYYAAISAEASNAYVDAHCWVFNPYSFCVIIADLAACGFIPMLKVVQILENGTEFIVHIHKGTNDDHTARLVVAERHELSIQSLTYSYEDVKVAMQRGRTPDFE